ncbi:site-specific DNA-methyltransferase [Sinomicrobium kalidii]|uniref:DNA-methyltransferase n=1 Tax=Sinomicrobium kalidii TaxID=2900738 RepID=UPI001E3D732D|nr:site-specific DNA-methyltransferase [Sinomicrobium kalidii]UGU17949.1 site-specific DNA-methyltransferase [Sinomicrobium kalidii]
MKSESTNHRVIIGAAQKMEQVEDNSIALVVTSPPYPMIEMWDDVMARQNPEIRTSLDCGKGAEGFEQMHSELDKVWAEVERVLMPGGFACINIGDATRTINNEFALYPNHARIINAFQKLGVPNLPNIIWRKQTNAPNKFMGSGMLPSGAYVTLEHEWILVFRKGGKRKFNTEADKVRRRESSFFWEERNIWFSDLWDFKGSKQKIENSETRKRSAAFPFELPYRLINMYSVQGDTVLDPFLGTGTTSLAAIASNRNSVGYEIDPMFQKIITDNITSAPADFYNAIIRNRIEKHMDFINERNADAKKGEIKHSNENLRLPVMTKQETGIRFRLVEQIYPKDDLSFMADYVTAAPVDTSILDKKKLDSTVGVV